MRTKIGNRNREKPDRDERIGTYIDRLNSITITKVMSSFPCW